MPGDRGRRVAFDPGVRRHADATAGERYRIFTGILESRSFLIPRRLLPDLKDRSRYGFALEET